jgi:spermidine/putrescine transport system substrate-binding protein
MKEIPVAGAVPQKKARGPRLRFVALGVLLAGLAAGLLSGCTKERLSIYNWTYYTPDSVIEKFEKEYNVKVIYDEFESNESMFAKLKSGGAGYDIVFPSGDYVSIMIKEGMLEKIDHSKLDNMGNIDREVLKKSTFDPNMEYSVPYYYGAAGVIVNTAEVPNYEESWSIFGRSDLRNHMTMLDDMREVMGDALAYLGYSVNSKNPSQINEAKNLINNSWRPNLTKFDAESFGKGYASGDFWVVQGYAEVVYEEIIDNPQLMRDTVYFFPKEGGPAYLDSMCILKGSKNVDLAHKFIDFIHRPEIYAEFCDEFGFPATANVPARRYKSGNTWYSEEDLYKTELKDDLGPALELYNNAWFNSIRVGN